MKIQGILVKLAGLPDKVPYITVVPRYVLDVNMGRIVSKCGLR
jgi:hypothetical protein